MAKGPEKFLTAGIDPSKHFHAVVVIRFPDRVVFKEKIDNSASSILKLDAKLCSYAQKHGLDVLYAPEDVTQYGGLLRRVLEGKNRSIKQINPSVVNALKVCYGDNKTDFIDAHCAALAAMNGADRTDNLVKKEKIYRVLEKATHQRQGEVKSKTQTINVLHQDLSETWSCKYVEFFSQLDGVTAIAFFKKFPSARLAKGISEKKIARFIFEKSKHTINLEESSKRARLICEVAGSFPDDSPEITEITETCIKDNLRMLELLITSIGNLEKKIEKLVDSTGFKLHEIKGIGAVTAGEIIGIVGDVTKRFADSDKLASFAGVAPREKSSGKKKRHFRSKRYSRRLKDSIMTATQNVLKYNEESKEYFNRKLSEGKTKQQAKKCLARRLCDIIYAMLRDKSQYDPERHKNKSTGKKPYKISNDRPSKEKKSAA